MRYTLYTHCLTQRALPINTWTTGVATGSTIDTGVFANDFRTVLFVPLTGVIVDGTHTFTVQESDNGSSWTALPADQLQGTPPAIVGADDHRAEGLDFGAVVKKRYVRVVLTSTAAGSGGPIGCVAVLGQASLSPTIRTAS